MKPRNHVLLATVFLVATTAFGAEPDGPWSGKLGRGWRVFVGNSQGLGDKGLQVPVDALKHGGASAQTQDGTTVAYRFFFQRNSQRPDAKDYEPIIFNIWLQRLEANVVASEELVARWVSPLGTIVDENSRKNVLWSDDFADQASDLGIYADDLEPLRAQVYATLQTRLAGLCQDSRSARVLSRH